MNVIELKGVSVRYRERRIRSLKEAAIRAVSAHPRSGYFYSLRDVSLAIRQGESVGIIGPNGPGKSTLLRVAAGIIAPPDGAHLIRRPHAPDLERSPRFEP